MYQLTLSLKERQELVQLLRDAIEEGEDWIKNTRYATDQRTINQVREQLAHLENIKMKVEQAEVMPIKRTDGTIK